MQRHLVAAFGLWSLAFLAAGVGYLSAHLGRSGLAVLALVVFVVALAGMFSVGRRPRSS